MLQMLKNFRSGKSLPPNSGKGAMLCITLTHDSGAALFLDGKLVAASSEERFTRKKQTRAFPHHSIAFCLDMANLRPDGIDLVVVASYITPSLAFYLIPSLYSGESESVFSKALHPFYAQQVFFRKTGLMSLENLGIRGFVRHRLKQIGISAPSIHVDHHLAHCYSAYAANDKDDTLVISMDAMGDGLSCMVCEGRGGQLNILDTMSGFSGLASIYAQVTQLLGFTPRKHEGKITGLAACGDPAVCAPIFREMMKFHEGKFKILRTSRQDHPYYTQLLSHRMEDIAAGLQQVTEELVISYVRKLIAKKGIRDICVAGGLFANVKLNQRLHEMAEVKSLFVFPHMGDGGLCVGSGYAVLKEKPVGMPNAYLGPRFSEDEIERALEKHGVEYRLVEDIEDAVAEKLQEGKVVARYAGRMEFGPRALGNRSILAAADDPTINQTLNDRLRRTEFMPFAPSTLDEMAHEYYLDFEKSRNAARFMTVSFNCTELSARVQPACVHVDNTARPQLVRKEDNPSYHRIISQYRAKTGVGSILNTSFNAHEAPIVCTPEDAVSSFLECGLEVLAIENFLATAPLK